MSTLSAGEIAQMRDVISDVTLAGTAIIQTATKTSDGQGGETWAYAASGTVSCHLSPETIRRGEAVTGGRIAEQSAWILTLPHDTTIDEDDQVLVDSVTYEVLEVLAPRTWQLAKRVRLSKVD